MATENLQPPTDAAASGGEANSTQSQRLGLSFPWASVVRGDPEQNSLPDAPTGAEEAGAPVGDSLSSPPEPPSASDSTVAESVGSEAQPEGSNGNVDSNAGRSRRPAWNRPVGGVPEPVAVMGEAVSWPALSETTRSFPRLSIEVTKPDGLASSSQAPIISPPPQRPAHNNGSTNSAANTSVPSRPRSRHRGGGNSSVVGTSQNAFNQHPLPMAPPPPPPPPFRVFEVPPYGMVPPPMLDASVRGPRGVGGSHAHASNDHSQRNNSRRGSYGPPARGDGTHSNNHRGRREQDRRDVLRPPPYLPPHMGYMPPPLPPGAGPFMPPPPVRVFPGQMGFDAAAPLFYVPTMPPDSFGAVPIVPHPPPPFYTPPDPLKTMIINQIEFYFSDDNLAKDKFLRSKMDPDHGWVPISVIASFRRVENLTKDVALILDALKYSTVVEVQDGQVRRRNEWRKWLPAPTWVNFDLASTSAPVNDLVTSFGEVSLNNSTANSIGARNDQTEMTTGRLLPADSTQQSRLAIGEGASEGNHSVSV